MEVTMTVEQFDNGISIKWRDENGKYDPQNIIAVDDNKQEEIGKCIWEDIKILMDANLTNSVELQIRYKAL